MAGHFGDAEDAMHVFIEASAPIPLERLTRAIQNTLYGYARVQAHKVPAPSVESRRSDDVEHAACTAHLADFRQRGWPRPATP